MKRENSFSNADATGHDPSVATDTPNYGIFSSWSCADWITFHKTLKAKYGKADADKKWMEAWNKQGFWDTDLSWCKYNNDFNAYCKSEGLPVSWLLADIVATTSNIARNVVTGAETTSSTLKWLIPVSLVSVAAIGLWFLYKKTKSLT